MSARKEKPMSIELDFKVSQIREKIEQKLGRPATIEEVVTACRYLETDVRNYANDMVEQSVVMVTDKVLYGVEPVM